MILMDTKEELTELRRYRAKKHLQSAMAYINHNNDSKVHYHLQQAIELYTKILIDIDSQY